MGYESGGALLPGRNYSSDSYRFGFNGKENDNEVHNATGTSVDFGDRMYDTRVGRWLSLDPLAMKYPDLSPYAFANNNPTLFVDEGGRTFRIYYETTNQQTGKPQTTYVDFNGTQAIAENGQAYVMGTKGAEFVDAVIVSYQYIVDNGADPQQIMQTIATSSTVINVQQIDNSDDSYDPKENTIEWDPKSGLHIEIDAVKATKNREAIDAVDGFQSPAIGLVNEAADAYLDEFMPKDQQKAEGLKTQEARDQWGIDRENDAVDGLKKKGFNETRRGTAATRGSDEYIGTEVEMTGPTSTTPKKP